MARLVAVAWIVDGRAGGYVIGRSHAEGHVYLVRQELDGEYHIFGCLQGGEYVLSQRAADLFWGEATRVTEWGSLPTYIRTLCTRAQPCDRLLLLHPRGQFIVNRAGTAAYLEQLDRMNEVENDFGRCDLGQLGLLGAAGC